MKYADFKKWYKDLKDKKPIAAVFVLVVLGLFILGLYEGKSKINLDFSLNTKQAKQITGPCSINTNNQSGGINTTNCIYPQVGIYTWVNNDSWTVEESSISEKKIGLYKVNLKFVADSPVLPGSFCLKTKTDTEIMYMLPDGNSSIDGAIRSRDGSSYLYSQCIQMLKQTEVVYIFFNKSPMSIQASLEYDQK